MKRLYPRLKKCVFSSLTTKTGMAILVLIAGFSTKTNAQTTQTVVVNELNFKNPALSSGTAGADGATYRFKSVMSNVDALVKINGRSSSMVKLVDIDLANTGFDKSFQPQVTYGSDNTSPAGNTDWWMEFQVSFVVANTTTLASISGFNVTGLDIDGNGDKISEYQSFYGSGTYTLEKNSQLAVSNVLETVLGKLTTTGKRFDGPVTNYENVDTGATKVMTTCAYTNTSSFRVRTGAKSTGVSGAADRMYSMWFKGFTYQTAVVNFLPVTIINWSAAYTNNNIALKWTTTQEINTSHFIIERSVDGIEYSDVALLFATGSTNTITNYSYTDNVPAANSGILYYRLKMVDKDQNYALSDVKIVRIGKTGDGTKIIVYPNPVVSELRITVPQIWQGKPVTYQLCNVYGQVIKTYSVQYASQTEVINMSQVPAGIYVMKAGNGTETAVQSVVKSAN